jgi:RND superfamily putative drug exporter
VLVALAIPALGLSFHGIDVNALPRGANARVASDVMAQEFEPAVSDEIMALLIHAPRSSEVAVDDYQEQVAKMPGVDNVYKAESIGRRLWEIGVVSLGPRLSATSIDLVKRLRGGHEPFPVEVSSPSASFLDQQASLRDHLLAIVLVIVLGTYALLFSMTRSIVLPLKTLAMNGLTFAATFGLIVLIFQRQPLMGLFAAGGDPWKSPSRF